MVILYCPCGNNVLMLQQYCVHIVLNIANYEVDITAILKYVNCGNIRLNVLRIFDFNVHAILLQFELCYLGYVKGVCVFILVLHIKYTNINILLKLVSNVYFCFVLRSHTHEPKAGGGVIMIWLGGQCFVKYRYIRVSRHKFSSAVIILHIVSTFQ